MANYKQGYQRKGNGDRFFTYLIVAFVAIGVVVLAGLGIYRISNPTLNYDSFVHIEEISDITEQPEDAYIVYYYGVNCSHCSDIKSDVLDFANSNDASVKVYFKASVYGEDPTVITHPVTGRAMTGTPSMVTVVNGVVVDLNVGKDVVVDLMEKVEEGSYGYFD